jgi:hypothetical protein
MASCATGDCGNPDCPVCKWARLPLPPRCQLWTDGQQCRFAAQHAGPCKPPKTGRKKRNQLRLW